MTGSPTWQAIAVRHADSRPGSTFAPRDNGPVTSKDRPPGALTPVNRTVLDLLTGTSRKEALVTIPPLPTDSAQQARRKRPWAISKYRRTLIYERDNYTCQHCGDDYSTQRIKTVRHRDGRDRLYTLEIDHIIPCKLGGTNAVDNLQSLCTPCNARKGARTQ